jgi:hypothetical protein
MADDGAQRRAPLQGEQLVGFPQVARELGIGVRLVQKAIETGPLPAYHVGTQVKARDVGPRSTNIWSRPSATASDSAPAGAGPVGLVSHGDSTPMPTARSVTHTWRELCEAYLKQVNERRARHAREKHWTFKPQRSLEFQDWGTVKGLWNDNWTQFYLNAPLHLIICGRAGYEYDFEETDNGKKELVKTGVKMRTEAEFGFEPSSC